MTKNVLNSSSSVICDGDSTILIVTGANSYQWSPSAGLSATTGDTVIANPSVSTTYSVVGTNGFGCMDSILHIITVNNIPSISVTPPSAAICMNDSVTLNATGALTYSWSPCGRWFVCGSTYPRMQVDNWYQIFKLDQFPRKA